MPSGEPPQDGSAGHPAVPLAYLGLDALAFRHVAVLGCRPHARVNADFNWWLLIVGLVVGAGLVWLVLADSNRRESEIAEEELPMEATWIAATMRDAGDPIEPEMTEHVLRLHRLYLASLPPDQPDESQDADADTAPSAEEPDVFEAPVAEEEPQPVEAPMKRSRTRRRVAGDPAD